VLYPIDKIEEMFSSYFLTSACAMVALAIYEIEELRKQFGTRDAAEESSACGAWTCPRWRSTKYQRPGCHFFVLEALAPRHRRLPAA